MFTDTTVQPEHSQCPLVEMNTTTSLFIVYRYDNRTGTITVPPGEDGFYYLSIYCYRYDSTTGTFTVPPGGDGFYYFSIFLTTYSNESAYFDLRINRRFLCSTNVNLDHTCFGDAWGSSLVVLRMLWKVNC